MTMISAPLSFSLKNRSFFGQDRFVSCLIALVILFFPDLVFAQNVANPGNSATIGDVMCNAANNIQDSSGNFGFVDLFDWMSYTAGGFIGSSGIYMLARNMEAPGQAPLPQAFARLTGASLLLALPSLAGTIIQSLYSSGGDLTSTLSTCAASDAPATASSSITLDVMLENFVNNIQSPLLSLLTVVSVAFGVFLMMQGALKASRYGTDPRTYSITSIATNFVFGAVFMVIGENVDMLMSTIFNTTSIQASNVLSWTSISSLGGNTTNFANAIQAALTFFQLIGFISFLRGWNVLKKAVEGNGQATMGQGLTHIIGGTLCINIYQFLQIMDTTFGTNFIS